MLNNTFCSKNFTNNINLSLNHDIDEYFGHDDVIGIYFHWPFCISKCNYCSFNSFVMNPPSNMIDLFISKINFFAEYLKNKTVIYVSHKNHEKYFDKVIDFKEAKWKNI